jgi:pimeloyl-ACP methyl ester carboxylesterase
VLRYLIFCTAFTVLLMVGSGCAPVVKYIAESQQGGSPARGITYYVGGAGPIGHVGSWEVPRGLADAGYPGLVEVFPWQGMTHAGDQINLTRNRDKAAELAESIKRYRRLYPDPPINIIALSAGTGIAAFALEYLPEGVGIDRVIFLGCSLSSRYDLTRALQRINGGLYVLYSPYDRILRNVVWYTGTVDRSSATEGVAGLEGFHSPRLQGSDTEAQYRKLHNLRYRQEFSQAGYGGGHTDAIQRAFVREYLADVLMDDGRRLLGERATIVERKPTVYRQGATTQPTSAPAKTTASWEVTGWAGPQVAEYRILTADVRAGGQIEAAGARSGGVLTTWSADRDKIRSSGEHRRW